VTNLETDGFVYPDPVAVGIDLIASPEPEQVKNRVRVDLAGGSRELRAALVAGSEALGMRRAEVGGGDAGVIRSWGWRAYPRSTPECRR
jgi:hypothetical protein